MLLRLVDLDVGDDDLLGDSAAVSGVEFQLQRVEAAQIPQHKVRSTRIRLVVPQPASLGVVNLRNSQFKFRKDGLKSMI